MFVLRLLVACLAISLTLTACSAQSPGQGSTVSFGGAARVLPAGAAADTVELAIAALDASSFQVKTVIDEERQEAPPNTGNVDGT